MPQPRQQILASFYPGRVPLPLVTGDRTLTTADLQATVTFLRQKFGKKRLHG